MLQQRIRKFFLGHKQKRRIFSGALCFLISAVILASAGFGVSALADDAFMFPVHITADGETRQIEVASTTVGNLLALAQVELGEYDEVYPLPDVRITGETHIRVYRVTRAEDLVYSTVPHPVNILSATDLPHGERVLVQAGIDGKKLSSYEVLTRDDGAQTYNLLEEVTLSEPVPAIWKNGVGQSVTTFAGDALYYKESMNVVTTAYTTEGRKNPSAARTFSGTTPQVGATVAVDPKVIPLGTRLYVVAEDGSWEYGPAVAEDTGGVIKGSKIDLFMATKKACYQHGIKNAVVYILE